MSKIKKVDLVVIGSGLSALNFIDTYLEKHKKVHVISPKKLKSIKKIKKRILPAQMKNDQNDVENFFHYNNFFLKDSCKALGTLKDGGFSNYWGLQMDNTFYHDQKNLKKIVYNEILKSFKSFLKMYGLVGQFKQKDKIVYDNNFKIPNFLEKLLKTHHEEISCDKPILGFLNKNLKERNLNNLKEEKSKLISKNFIKIINNKGKIVFHDYFVEKIKQDFKKINIFCNNSQKKTIVIQAKKVIFAAGTLTTTKILADYLKIKSEIKVKHHQRLFSVFVGRKPIDFNLKFTPSILQIKNNLKKFCADLRPGNKMITESIIDAYPLSKPFKFFLNLLKNRMIFSNVLLDSSFSNIFMKKQKDFFILYSKKNNAKDYLIKKNKKIFNFLVKKKIIFPFYKTLYPGSGADYHYFGTIPFHNKGKLSVNDSCQLKNNKNIYIIDGSVFNFKFNKYPLGWIIANARRVGKKF